MSRKNLSVKIKIPKFFRDKLKDKKINLIYKRFEKSLNINENFGVAVSGGPDSLALAFLAKTYSLKRKINPKFFIVDHKLREESTMEAKAIQKILKRASINLLKLGVSMVQIGEKDQGCKMINGVEKQYPNANQSVIQKAKYESQKFECKNQNS